MGGLDRPAMIELQCQYTKTRWEETATEAEAEMVETEDMADTNLIDRVVQV